MSIERCEQDKCLILDLNVVPFTLLHHFQNNNFPMLVHKNEGLIVIVLQHNVVRNINIFSVFGMARGYIILLNVI